MTRLFLDSNVLFTAAHNPEGKASLVIELAGSGSWEVVSSAYCMAEAHMNLELKYPASLGRLGALMRTVRRVPDVAAERCELPLPEKDKPIFAAARRCSATHLLTGDRRHFGAYMNNPGETKGITIQTVADFLRERSRA